jgi:hypothetical protein
MTDKEKGAEADVPVAHQDDSFGLEEAPAAWQGDLPEDGFHDEAEAMVEEAEMPEEETASSVDVATAAKKRGTMIALGALGGGALLVALLVFLQFGVSGDGSGGPTPIASVIEAKLGGDAAGKRNKSPHDTAAQVDSVVSATSAETDVTSIYNAGLSQTVAPNNSVAIPNSVSSKGLEKPSASSSISSEVMGLSGPKTDSEAVKGGEAQVPSKPVASAAMPVPELQPAPKATGADGAKTGVAPKTGAVDMAPPPAPPSPASAPATSTDEARLRDLTAQIADLRKMIAQTAQQATQLASRLDQQPNASGPSSTAMDDRLARLEERLNALAAAKTTSAKAARPAPPSSMPVDAGVAVTAAEPSEPVVAEPVKKTTHSKRVKKAKTKAIKPTKKAAKGRWVLRAATPDAAWVSSSETAEELRPVHVGETLPGVGRVKAIKQSGDNWVVVGTKGVVR